jgi:hypothetical protein
MSSSGAPTSKRSSPNRPACADRAKRYNSPDRPGAGRRCNLFRFQIAPLATCVLLACLLVLNSCAKAEFLLNGISLPPGSTVTNKVTGKMDNGAQPPISMPMGMPGMPSMQNCEYVTVSFTNSGGWGAVTSHFDSQLGRLGFADTMKSLGGAAAMPQAGGFLESMRMYSKNGNKVSVMLMDMSGILGGVSLPGGMPGGGTIPSPLGDFTMMVMRAK